MCSTKDENDGDLNHSRSLCHRGRRSATPNEHSNTSCWQKKARTARPHLQARAFGDCFAIGPSRTGILQRSRSTLESRLQLKSDAGTHRIPKALCAKSRSEAETTEDGSTRWFAVVAGVSPARPKCCGWYNCRSSEPYCSQNGCLYNQNFFLKRREGTTGDRVVATALSRRCCLRAIMHERLDTARRLQREAAQEVSRVSCDRFEDKPIHLLAVASCHRLQDANDPPQEARNSRVASRVPICSS